MIDVMHALDGPRWGVLGFPDPVNEKAARTVAGVVATTSVVALATGWHWLLVPLAYGFVARVATGPRLSPLGWFAMRVVAPRLGEPRPTPGPPKRFAQVIGAACTLVGAIGGVALGWDGVAVAVLAIMIVFATFEAAFGLCVGCRIFGVLMRAGLVPAETCAACADIWARPGSSTGSDGSVRPR